MEYFPGVILVLSSSTLYYWPAPISLLTAISQASATSDLLKNSIRTTVSAQGIVLILGPGDA